MGHDVALTSFPKFSAPAFRIFLLLNVILLDRNLPTTCMNRMSGKPSYSLKTSFEFLSVLIVYVSGVSFLG